MNRNSNNLRPFNAHDERTLFAIAPRAVFHFLAARAFYRSQRYFITAHLYVYRVTRQRSKQAGRQRARDPRISAIREAARGCPTSSRPPLSLSLDLDRSRRNFRCVILSGYLGMACSEAWLDKEASATRFPDTARRVPGATVWSLSPRLGVRPLVALYN